MRVGIPQGVGLLAAVWALREFHIAVSLGGGVLVGVFGLLWLVAAMFLIAGRENRLTYVLMMTLSMAEFVVVGAARPYGLAMLFWIGLIMAVTESLPRDRAFLLRNQVAVVYVFGAISKLNPSWLQGEGLQELAETRPHMEFLAGAFDSSLLPLYAVLVVLLELWLPLGLWIERTRRATAVVGVGLHVVLVAAAAGTLYSLSNLAVLNFGLVVLYPAFWGASPGDANAVRTTS